MEAAALFAIATELQARGDDADALRCFLALRTARSSLHLKHIEPVDLAIAELYLQLTLANPDDTTMQSHAKKSVRELPDTPSSADDDIFPFETLEWTPRRLRCTWMLHVLQNAPHSARIAALCEGVMACEGHPELTTWHRWFVGTLQDQLHDAHAAVLDRLVPAASFSENASSAYSMVATTADMPFKLWLLETLCHSFLAADVLVVESATKMFDFCDQFSAQVADDALRFYFVVVRLLLYLRTGDIVQAQAFLKDIPPAPPTLNAFWTHYVDFVSFRLLCYYDPAQCLAVSARQMQHWPPYLASPASAPFLRYSALALFETYEVACYLLDTQGRFTELADLAAQMLKLCATYRHVVVSTPLAVARVHVILARYTHGVNAMDAAVTHINAAFSLLLAETPAWPQQSDASLLVLMDILDVATTIAVHPLPELDPTGNMVVDLSDEAAGVTTFYPTENLLEFAAGILRDGDLRKLIYDGHSKEVRAKYDLYLGKWLWASSALGMEGSYPELDGLRSFALSILQDSLELASTAINCSNTTAAIMVLFGPRLVAFGKMDEGERTLTNALKVAMHTKNVRLQLQIMVEVHASCARKYQVKAQGVVAAKYKKKLESHARKIVRALQNTKAHRKLLKWTLPPPTTE
ncbi:hypothetical protein ACHHYP_11730 [Achlya hypogyna]|uniref:Uncharacterized protein n=1 Tax=Achlya hypogyna TaxID=1202772 RepID=A0A1V9YII7_ACHHY|nr:hypothetical protein ACHHYP_11730 [Achlya hypogyna]